MDARSEACEEVTEAPKLEIEEASEGSDVETTEERDVWGRNFRASSSQLPNLIPPVMKFLVLFIEPSKEGMWP